MSNFLVSRRSFLGASAAIASICLFPRQALAKESSIRSLGLEHQHTGESLRIEYWEQGSYIEESIQQINYLLRDHRVDEVHPIDTNLVDQLYLLNQLTENNKSFKVFSGYRSRATNELLRKRSTGVAKNSLHIVGKAIDIELPGLSIKQLSNAAKQMQLGGVGTYNRFVHMDTGKVRYW